MSAGSGRELCGAAVSDQPGCAVALPLAWPRNSQASHRMRDGIRLARCITSSRSWPPAPGAPGGKPVCRRLPAGGAPGSKLVGRQAPASGATGSRIAGRRPPAPGAAGGPLDARRLPAPGAGQSPRGRLCSPGTGCRSSAGSPASTGRTRTVVFAASQRVGAGSRLSPPGQVRCFWSPCGRPARRCTG